MPPTELTTQLAAQIADHIRTGNAPKGTRLVERVLAENLRVSRSPVRSALRLLAEEGVVGTTDRGGFVVAQGSDALPARPQPPTGDEEAYLAIAEDRLKEVLPEKVTGERAGAALQPDQGTACEGSAQGRQRGLDRTPTRAWLGIPAGAHVHAGL